MYSIFILKAFSYFSHPASGAYLAGIHLWLRTFFYGQYFRINTVIMYHYDARFGAGCHRQIYLNIHRTMSLTSGLDCKYNCNDCGTILTSLLYDMLDKLSGWSCLEYCHTRSSCNGGINEFIKTAIELRATRFRRPPYSSETNPRCIAYTLCYFQLQVCYMMHVSFFAYIVNGNVYLFRYIV